MYCLAAAVLPLVSAQSLDGEAREVLDAELADGSVDGEGIAVGGAELRVALYDRGVFLARLGVALRR